ncbi:hypothetical protein QBC44DRAFT_158578 [Cladorrhinum sp. PSN332]|nr:hypothetical protein QBC44DRAFT_158578 [Cladorrhinum sp. PSN332]
MALLSACQAFRTIPRLRRVELQVEGALPRRAPPLYVDELDLERAPLHIIVLLYQFRLLSGIIHVSTSTVGGPRNDPWENHTWIGQFGHQVVLGMTSGQLPAIPSALLVVNLGKALGEGGPQQACWVGFLPESGVGRRFEPSSLGATATSLHCLWKPLRVPQPALQTAETLSLSRA